MSAQAHTATPLEVKTRKKVDAIRGYMSPLCDDEKIVLYLADQRDVLVKALQAVRDSFIYVDDHSETAVMPEAENHAFDEVCAALKAAGAA
jgi:hypothetical protein